MLHLVTRHSDQIVTRANINWQQLGGFGWDKIDRQTFQSTSKPVTWQKKATSYIPFLAEKCQLAIMKKIFHYYYLSFKKSRLCCQTEIEWRKLELLHGNKFKKHSSFLHFWIYVRNLYFVRMKCWILPEQIIHILFVGKKPWHAQFGRCDDHNKRQFLLEDFSKGSKVLLNDAKSFSALSESKFLILNVQWGEKRLNGPFEITYYYSSK